MNTIQVGKDTEEEFERLRTEICQTEGYVSRDNFLRILLSKYKTSTQDKVK